MTPHRPPNSEKVPEENSSDTGGPSYETRIIAARRAEKLVAATLAASHSVSPEKRRRE